MKLIRLENAVKAKSCKKCASKHMPSIVVGCSCWKESGTYLFVFGIRMICVLLVLIVMRCMFISYKTRVHKALVSLATGRPNIMSIIIDGMDQSSCTIPHLGSQDTFGNPLKQGMYCQICICMCIHGVSLKDLLAISGITGVKEHGVGVTLYRTVNTVRKGANLTIYCITKQLENFYDRHKCYPDDLYIQADGGAENANKYVLAALELLVVKRVVKKIVFSRLPTGKSNFSSTSSLKKIIT